MGTIDYMEASKLEREREVLYTDIHCVCIFMEEKKMYIGKIKVDGFDISDLCHNLKTKQ